jgi:diphthine-ammonia ligase
MEHVQTERCALSFSGGKDSMLALDRAVRQGLQVDYLFTLYEATNNRVRFHGVHIDLIQAQADALGIPLLKYPYQSNDFEAVFLSTLNDLHQRGISTILFGNIHLADVRAWYEQRTTAIGFIHREPLWGEPPSALVCEFIARGYLAVLTCIELTHSNPAWLGRTLTNTLVRAFEQAGIDACGERGEYHSFVHVGPLFKKPLPIRLGQTYLMPGNARFLLQEINL